MTDNRSFKEKAWHRWHIWIGAWLDIFGSIIRIITFTWILPYWDYKYLYWHSMRSLKRRIKE